jgi:hypothetical protein
MHVYIERKEDEIKQYNLVQLNNSLKLNKKVTVYRPSSHEYKDCPDKAF